MKILFVQLYWNVFCTSIGLFGIWPCTKISPWSHPKLWKIMQKWGVKTFLKRSKILNCTNLLKYPTCKVWKLVLFQSWNAININYYKSPQEISLSNHEIYMIYRQKHTNIGYPIWKVMKVKFQNFFSIQAIDLKCSVDPTYLKSFDDINFIGVAKL